MMIKWKSDARNTSRSIRCPQRKITTKSIRCVFTRINISIHLFRWLCCNSSISLIKFKAQLTVNWIYFPLTGKIKRATSLEKRVDFSVSLNCHFEYKLSIALWNWIRSNRRRKKSLHFDMVVTAIQYSTGRAYWTDKRQYGPFQVPAIVHATC